MNKTAYIAGPVKGIDAQQVAEAFTAKERELLRRGYQVTNPVALVTIKNIKRQMVGVPLLDDGANRQLTLKHCIHWLSMCDELHLLQGWQFSEGAQIEHKVAELLRIKIVYPD